MVKIVFEDGEDIKISIMNFVNILSIIVFAFSTVGLGFSIFLKHIHMFTISLIIISASAYMIYKTRNS